MNRDRYNALMSDDDLPLSPEELAIGWHFCCEWDGLLVGPGMGELRPCKCLPESHPVYQTIPKEDGPPGGTEITQQLF